MLPRPFILLLLALSVLSSCNNKAGNNQPPDKDTISADAIPVLADSIVYQSPDLIIRQIAANTYQHISWLQTESFGKVDCNGMIVADNNEAVVFDTPANEESAAELISYFTKRKYKINAIVATHFHGDCVGGLKKFHEQHIPSYALNLTRELVKKDTAGFAVPQNGFADSLTIDVGNKKVYAVFMGEGHTRDNVVGYFPDAQVLFGGCLVKEIGAGKGYLADANVSAWSATIQKIKEKYPALEKIIPGHGRTGGPALLDFTAELFKQ